MFEMGSKWGQFHKLIFWPCRPAPGIFGSATSRNGCGMAKTAIFHLPNPYKPEKRLIGGRFGRFQTHFSRFFVVLRLPRQSDAIVRRLAAIAGLFAAYFAAIIR